MGFRTGARTLDGFLGALFRAEGAPLMPPRLVAAVAAVLVAAWTPETAAALARADAEAPFPVGLDEVESMLGTVAAVGRGERGMRTDLLRANDLADEAAGPFLDQLEALGLDVRLGTRALHARIEAQRRLAGDGPTGARLDRLAAAHIVYLLAQAIEAALSVAAAPFDLTPTRLNPRGDTGEAMTRAVHAAADFLWVTGARDEAQSGRGRPVVEADTRVLAALRATLAPPPKAGALGRYLRGKGR